MISPANSGINGTPRTHVPVPSDTWGTTLKPDCIAPTSISPRAPGMVWRRGKRLVFKFLWMPKPRKHMHTVTRK